MKSLMNRLEIELTSMQLELVETKPDDGAFARLTSAARCGGNGGLSGYDDLALPERWIKCPTYGQC